MPPRSSQTILDDIWYKLSNEDIGFFTSRRAEKIPSGPGVYGWFYPLEFRERLDKTMSYAEHFYSYDAKQLGPAKWVSENAGFNWEPLHCEIRRDPDRPKSDQLTEAIKLITDLSGEKLDAARRAILVGSLFSKPLYVGVASSLSSRYKDHAEGRDKGNSFHRRFTAYVGSLKSRIRVSDLLFVCISLPRTGFGNSRSIKDQCTAIETLLKVICKPAFSDR